VQNGRKADCHTNSSTDTMLLCFGLSAILSHHFLHPGDRGGFTASLVKHDLLKFSPPNMDTHFKPHICLASVCEVLKGELCGVLSK
jgi:hypothetical protein